MNSFRLYSDIPPSSKERSSKNKKGDMQHLMPHLELELFQSFANKFPERLLHRSVVCDLSGIADGARKRGQHQTEDAPTSRKAEMLRTLATKMPDANFRASMLKMAAAYDGLAEMLSRRLTSKNWQGGVTRPKQGTSNDCSIFQ